MLWLRENNGGRTFVSAYIWRVGVSHVVATPLTWKTRPPLKTKLASFSAIEFGGRRGEFARKYSVNPLASQVQTWTGPYADASARRPYQVGRFRRNHRKGPSHAQNRGDKTGSRNIYATPRELTEQKTPALSCKQRLMRHTNPPVEISALSNR